MELEVVSAGAAKGLVLALAPALQAATGAAVRGEFGAVGAILDKFLAGAPCDVIILTAALLDTLVQDGRVQPDTVAPLGRVRTGIAVRAGDKRLPLIADRGALRQTLLAATGIYLPDPERSTAGAHFQKVLRDLGIHDAVASRLHVFANGAIAMRELGQSREAGPIGCTQITEINYTPGVALVGPLPAEFELATTYCVAVATAAPHPGLARRFAQMITGAESMESRRAGGFEF
jgi:molybdate transport system substrate-binding protein